MQTTLHSHGNTALDYQPKKCFVLVEWHLNLHLALENKWLLFCRLAVIDLVVAMAPFVDEASMTQTFSLIKPFVEVRIFLLLF